MKKISKVISLRKQLSARKEGFEKGFSFGIFVGGGVFAVSIFVLIAIFG